MNEIDEHELRTDSRIFIPGAGLIYEPEVKSTTLGLPETAVDIIAAQMLSEPLTSYMLDAHHRSANTSTETDRDNLTDIPTSKSGYIKCTESDMVIFNRDEISEKKYSDATPKSFSYTVARRTPERAYPVLPGNELTPEELADLVMILDTDEYGETIGYISDERISEILRKVELGGAVLDKDEPRYSKYESANNDYSGMTTDELWAIICISEGRTPSVSQRTIDSALNKLQSCHNLETLAMRKQREEEEAELCRERDLEEYAAQKQAQKQAKKQAKARAKAEAKGWFGWIWSAPPDDESSDSESPEIKTETSTNNCCVQ